MAKVEKRDCFAFHDIKKGCSILKVRTCADCKFYKTKGELFAQEERCRARLHELGHENYQSLLNPSDILGIVS